MTSFKKTSIKDIATAAGVSSSLVSFVLNGKSKEHRIGEETSRKILQIAKDLNYQPNLAAKSLRSGKTKTIGLVVSDISNPFFSQLARTFEDEASKRGYLVFFGSSDEDVEKLKKVVSNFINKGIDGLIIVPCEKSEKFISSLIKGAVPIVLFDRYYPDQRVSYVALNNYQASYTLTINLLNKGYESPCMIAYDIDLIHMKERIEGYKQAMEDSGKKKQSRVFYLKQDSPRKSADRIFPKLLENPIDSFVFATNIISLTSLHVIQEIKHEIPSNLGLACFDGNAIFDFLATPVTYIQQPIDILVHKALEILMDSIATPHAVQAVLADGVLVEKG